MKGLIVDIDDTLSITTKRWMKIFMRAYGNPEGLTVDQLYNKYRLVQNVPYWRIKGDSQNLITYLTNNKNFQLTLREQIGASKALIEINKIIPINLYLTKRPVAVESATIKWLMKHGFPTANVIHRPMNVRPEEGTHWKLQYILECKQQVAGVIDDDFALAMELVAHNLNYYLFGFTKLDFKYDNLYYSRNWYQLLNILKKNAEFN